MTLSVIGFKTLRSGWLAAILTLLCVLTILAQTEPRAIVVWDAINSPVLTGYVIKRGISPTSPTVDSIVEKNINTWLDATIEPTIKYWFGVAGLDNDEYPPAREGEIGWAINNPFRFSDIQPASPANLTAVKTTSTTPGRIAVRVSWGLVTKTRSLLLLPTGAVVTYNVFVANTGTIQKLTVLQGTSITVGGMKKNQTMYFYVTSVWEGIESLGSPAVRIQT